MTQESGFLQGVRNLSTTWGRIAVICQLHAMRQDGGCLQGVYYSACTLKQYCGCLSATWDGCLQGVCVLRLSVFCKGGVLCQLHDTGLRLSAECVYLSVTWDNMAVICQLHETAGRLSIGLCNMSVTWGRIAVVCLDGAIKGATREWL